MDDSGLGTAADALPHIFVRARSATKAEGDEGTGLGLDIAKGVMEAHGGSIAAESPTTEGSGTCITGSIRGVNTGTSLPTRPPSHSLIRFMTPQNGNFP